MTTPTRLSRGGKMLGWARLDLSLIFACSASLGPVPGLGF